MAGSAPRSAHAARGAAVVAATVGLSLLVAACGGSPGSHVDQLGSTSTHATSSSGFSRAGESTSPESLTSQMLAFSRCMRSHGEPRFPDPDGQGQVKEQLKASGIDVKSSHYQAAAGACEALLPSGGTGTTRAEVQQEWTEFRSFARCMRRHGVPNWPDPQPRSGTDLRPIFDIQPVDPLSPIDPGSTQIKSTLADCDMLLKTANPNRL